MKSARQTALAALERCRRDGAWSAQVLDQLLRREELDPRDAALAVSLCMGVLHNLRYLDYYIALYCSASHLQPKVRDVLRLGACQLLLMDRIPDRAAVNETVGLCKSAGLERAAGLVNAVLRRLAENKDSLPEIPGKGSAAYLAVRYSQPDWLTERLLTQRGYAFTEKFFRACAEPAPTDLQINPLRISADEFAVKLDEQSLVYERPPMPENCFSVKSGSISQCPGFEEGWFFVQDRAAAMAAGLAGVRPGMKVLDACAAPGGKSFAAAIAMKDHGQIVSCDIHEKKLQLIQSGAARLGLHAIHTEVRDARTNCEGWHAAFDTVIADVPCSGFGVMRKKPEIRMKTESEVRELPLIQTAILDNLSQYVVPGGTLLYSTCTVLREENEDIIENFLSRHPEYMPCDFNLGSRSSVGGCYTFWTHLDGSDGFFAARLKRKT